MAIDNHRKGISAAISSALFLGMVPIFGKIAILSGFTPYAVIAIRTCIAAILTTFLMLIWKRQFFYIYPVGLAGCLFAGFINGLGSILYYTALGRLDASIGHMLYSFYPLFLAVWLLLDRQTFTRVTLLRLGLSVPAVIFLIFKPGGSIDLVGAFMMLGAAVLYALHLLINQRVLYEAPAPTVTLYTLFGMALTVSLGFLILDHRAPLPQVAWYPVAVMAFITFFSRFTLFLGLKHIGGLQTALLGLGEVFITVFLSQVLLGERLSSSQWIGAILMGGNLLLVGFDRIIQYKRQTTGFLSWLNPPKIRVADFNWPGQV